MSGDYIRAFTVGEFTCDGQCFFCVLPEEILEENLSQRINVSYKYKIKAGYGLVII
jgi:hypothetical protein